MSTELKPGPGQQQPSHSTPGNTEAGEYQGVTTSSGIRFSLPSWAEKESPVNRLQEPEQAGP